MVFTRRMPSSPALPRHAWKWKCHCTHAAYQPSAGLQLSPAACAAASPAKAPGRAGLGDGRAPAARGGCSPAGPGQGSPLPTRSRWPRACRAPGPGFPPGRLDFVCKIFLSRNCGIITGRINPTRRIYNVETLQRLMQNSAVDTLFFFSFGEERLFRGKETAAPRHCPPNVTPLPGRGRCPSARRVFFSLGLLAASENDI